MDGTGDTGIEGGATFVEFAKATLVTDAGQLADARTALHELCGDSGLVDAAGMVAMFDAFDRIAGATGIPLLGEVMDDTADFRAEIGLNDFLTAGS